MRREHDALALDVVGFGVELREDLEGLVGVAIRAELKVYLEHCLQHHFFWRIESCYSSYYH